MLSKATESFLFTHVNLSQEQRDLLFGTWKGGLNDEYFNYLKKTHWGQITALRRFRRKPTTWYASTSIPGVPKWKGCLLPLSHSKERKQLEEKKKKANIWQVWPAETWALPIPKSKIDLPCFFSSPKILLHKNHPQLCQITRQLKLFFNYI